LSQWNNILKESFQNNKNPSNHSYNKTLYFIKNYRPTIIENDSNNFFLILEHFPHHQAAVILQLHSTANSFIQVAKTFEKAFNYCHYKGYTNVFSLQTKTRSKKYSKFLSHYTTVLDKYQPASIKVIPKNTRPEENWIWFIMGQQTYEEDYVLKENIGLQFRSL
jgi:hypothetical protein